MLQKVQMLDLQDSDVGLECKEQLEFRPISISVSKINTAPMQMPI